MTRPSTTSATVCGSTLTVVRWVRRYMIRVTCPHTTVTMRGPISEVDKYIDLARTGALSCKSCKPPEALL